MMQKHFSEIIKDFPYIEEPQEPKPILRGKYQKWKYENNYRKATEQYKSCKYCRNCVGISHHDKTYYKCNIQGFSRGAATDIRLSYVCDFFRNYTAQNAR